MKCIEKNIEPYDVYTADEAFMIGTPFFLLPVTSLNQLPIGNKKIGKITKLLLDTWSRHVGVDIPKQIKRFNVSPKGLGEKVVTPYSFKG